VWLGFLTRALSSDPRGLEERLLQAQKAWQANMARWAAEEALLESKKKEEEDRNQRTEDEHVEAREIEDAYQKAWQTDVARLEAREIEEAYRKPTNQGRATAQNNLSQVISKIATDAKYNQGWNSIQNIQNRYTTDSGWEHRICIGLLILFLLFGVLPIVVWIVWDYLHLP
jgi:hypothetical protein